MTKTLEKSRFHWLLGGESDAARNLWDQELHSSRSFAVVPSLGSLVPGWVLIVPRRPMVSFRDLNSEEREEVSELVAVVAGSLEVFGGQIFAFEHGSDHKGSKMGCGVDQAHLHLVPLKFDLIDWVASQPDEGVEWSIRSEFLLTDLPPTGEYISVWEVSSRRGALASVSKPVSQWMRRAIANKLGVHRDWDYRASPQLENIRLTMRTMRQKTLSTK